MLEPTAPEPRKANRPGLKIALVAAGIAAGAIGATAIGASATTSGTGNSSATAPASTSTAAPGVPGNPPPDRHGSGPGRGDETQLTGTQAATLKAAAFKAVPGGTIDRVETDSGDATYEAHMTKSDGTRVTVKFDKNLKVTKVESGMGQ